MLKEIISNFFYRIKLPEIKEMLFQAVLKIKLFESNSHYNLSFLVMELSCYFIQIQTGDYTLYEQCALSVALFKVFVNVIWYFEVCYSNKVSDGCLIAKLFVAFWLAVLKRFIETWEIHVGESCRVIHFGGT